MDEAEAYQQRLQAIAERRQQQEEEKRLRRETEEEWLKTAQEKRKCLREQWLSGTAPAPVDSSGARPPQQDQHTVGEETKSQKTPEEEEEEEAADAREEANDESVEYSAAARANRHYQAGTDEDVQVNTEDQSSIQMAQRMFHESGRDGRSVLGTLAVQVERDPKTGATVVRSVAPVSSPAAAPTAGTVFDDGRKSIHAVGRAGNQPTSEELGQILSAIDGVGMKVLLDEVNVTPKTAAEPKIEIVDAGRAPEGRVLSFPSHHAVSEEEKMQVDSSRKYNLESDMGIEGWAFGVGNKQEEKGDANIMAFRDIPDEVCYVDDQKLKEGPVTLVFLGYADATTDQGQGQEEDQGVIKVERVMITEEGEEHVLGPETSASPQESQGQVFQDVPLEGNGAGGKVHGEEDDAGLHNSSSPSKAAGDGTPKRKTCQCCSVM